MSVQNETKVLVLSLLVTTGLMGAALVGVGNISNKQPNLFNTESATAVDRHGKGDIRVLGDTFSGYSTLRNIDFQNTLKEQEVTLKYANEFDQKVRATALSTGKVDIIVTTLDQFLTHKPEGQIVALIDRTVGADAVVLNSQEYPQLKSLNDLDNLVQQKRAVGEQLKIVYAGDTPSEFLAKVLDTKFDNFNLADFEIVKVADASEAWQQMQKPNSQVGITVLWEPYVTEAKAQGNTVVLSSADAPRVIVDVVVASDRVISSNPGAVSSFVTSYYRRMDTSIQDQTQLTQQIAADGDLSNAEATSVRQGIQFFTSVEANNWIESGTLTKRIRAIAGVLALSGRTDAIPANPETLFTNTFLKTAAEQTTNLIKAVEIDNPELAKKLRGFAEPVFTTEVSVAEVKQADDIGNLKVRGEVKFETGAAQLTPQGQQTLDKLATEISEFNPSTVAIKVQGHTSRTGSADLNQKLSQGRADVVVQYLNAKNLPHKFVAEGLGFSQTLPGADPASPVNQRTVIRLVRIGN
ncbi:MAG: phosphate ABC transporter substrate-binding/OmpA family protein [Spirulinaceae cyanobacterium]